MVWSTDKVEEVRDAARILYRAATSDTRPEYYNDETLTRFAKAWHDIFEDRHLSNEEIADRLTVFPANGIDQMVLVQDINFYSVCEHHLLPFFGKVHIAYLPDELIVGLSKFARATKMVAGRLQVQERMTEHLAHLFEYRLKPLGIAVIVQARHSCMEMRGIRHPGAITTTSAIRGEFRQSESLRSELFATINAERITR